MRIALDARPAGEVPAGRGRYVRGLLGGLSRLNVDHEFLLYARRPWLEASLDERFRWEINDAGGPAWPLLTGRAMSRKADVGVASSSYLMTAGWRIPGAAIVFDLVPFDRSLSPPRGSLFERATLPLAIRRGVGFVAISEATKRALTDRFRVDPRRVSVAHPGCEPRFTPVSGPGTDEVLSRLGVRQPYALATGTVEPRKNLPRLIEAFGSLEPELRRGWTLVVVGAPGWATDASFAAAARHRDVVSTLGFVPDEELACLYRQADVFCYLSLQEGFGIPVLEAMQSGTAVLTSNVSSMPEVAGGAARYANPRDVADIRRGLRELLGDSDLRTRLAASGIERARRFDWQQSAGRVVRFLEDRAG